MIRQTVNESVRYCGRVFTAYELDEINRIVASGPDFTRRQLSRIVCDRFHWLRPDGRRKDMSCRVAMLRMHRDGLIRLPAPRQTNFNSHTHPAITSASDPQKPISVPAHLLGELHIRPVNNKNESSLWNQLIERYHYLGYKPIPGAQIRYLAFSEGHRLIAALSFGASAWKIKPRDRFIGWSHQQRISKLHLIANNSRFLILPWVSSRNLASRILATCAKRLPSDWQQKYNYQPILLETFVQKDRFRGTCYRAANWIHVGQTQGRGKLDRHTQRLLPVKDIFLYPLRKDFRRLLAA